MSGTSKSQHDHRSRVSSGWAKGAILLAACLIDLLPTARADPQNGRHTKHIASSHLPTFVWHGDVIRPIELQLILALRALNSSSIPVPALPGGQSITVAALSCSGMAQVDGMAASNAVAALNTQLKSVDSNIIQQQLANVTTGANANCDQTKGTHMKVVLSGAQYAIAYIFRTVPESGGGAIYDVFYDPSQSDILFWQANQ